MPEVLSRALDRRRGSFGAVERLAYASLIGAIALLGIGYLIISNMKQAAWQDARSESMTIVNILGEHIRRTFGEAKSTLLGVIAFLEAGEQIARDQDHLKKLLLGSSYANGALHDVRVLDRHGTILFATGPVESTIGERQALAMHISTPRRDLLISEPILTANGGYEFVASLPFYSGGEISGVVTVRLPIAEIEQLYESVQLDRGDVLGLLYNGERIVYRTTDGTRQIGVNVSKTAIAVAMRATAAGSLEVSGTIDKVTRLYTHAKVMGLPLHVYLAKDIGTLSERFWDNTRWIALLIGLFAMVQTGVSVGLVLQARARATLEAKLREMATTDALTNLGNRRSFDDALAAEWRRAARTRTPVGLLMVDADFFKRYNDTYGHAAGDSLLQRIAAAVKQCAQRTSDATARFGGEEFAVLLPGLDLTSTLAVGEALRQRIEHEGWEHTGHPLKVATVSIGAATMIPDAEACDPLDLVMLADMALYNAKAQGRNRVATCQSECASTSLLRAA